MRYEYRGKTVIVPMGFGFFINGSQNYSCISSKGHKVGEYPPDLDPGLLKEKLSQDIDKYLDSLRGDKNAS